MENNNTDNSDLLLYVNNNSLSKDLCKDLIQFFENDLSNYGYEGIVQAGVKKHIKDTTDMVITNHLNDNHWTKVNKVLLNELQYNIAEYIEKLSDNLDKGTNTTGHNYNYNVVCSDQLTIPAMQMQKYNKNTGKYLYHNDYQCDFNKKQMRIITFLWYINDVKEGGETQFWKNVKIKPTAGKLILFPASWT